MKRCRDRVKEAGGRQIIFVSCHLPNCPPFCPPCLGHHVQRSICPLLSCCPPRPFQGLSTKLSPKCLRTRFRFLISNAYLSPLPMYDYHYLPRIMNANMKSSVSQTEKGMRRATVSAFGESKSHDSHEVLTHVPITINALLILNLPPCDIARTRHFWSQVNLLGFGGHFSNEDLYKLGAQSEITCTQMAVLQWSRKTWCRMSK